MENNPNEKIVVFKSIGYILLSVVFIYLKLGYKVMYFEMNEKIKQFGWVRRAEAQHKLEDLPLNNFDLELYYATHDLALNNIERLYNSRFEKGRLAKLMAVLLKSQMVHAAYKKALIEKLQEFYWTQTLLNDFAIKNNLESITFLPIEFITPASAPMEFAQIKNRVESAGVDDSESRIRVPLWARIASVVAQNINKAICVAYLGSLPVRTLWKVRSITAGRRAPSSYRVGIRIYRSDFSFYYEHRSIDFLLDNKKLSADNVIFCIDTDISYEYRQKLRDKGYNTVDIPNILAEIDIAFIKSIFIKSFLPTWCISTILSFLEPNFMIITTEAILHRYLLWMRFIELYCIKHFVAYNDTAPKHIVRNIILSQKEIQTCYYEHSCHIDNLFASPDGSATMRNVIFSFLYYDNFVVWGDKFMRFFDSHPNYIKRYLNLGCLWSEHVARIAQEKVKLSISSKFKLTSNVQPAKIIGVFDTTFATAGSIALLQREDMVSFLEGILKLLDDIQEIAVIFKMKIPLRDVLGGAPRMAPIYERLQNHERCYFIGDRTDASEITAVSDLVISACFTSPTIEALGARKKGIYFDATGRFRGYYYDRFSELVAHGYDELKNLVHYWLYKISDKEFGSYLETYVKGELDGYTDAQAITRFRKLLASD